MMPVRSFVSRLGITDLIKNIKIYVNLIELFNFETYIIFFISKCSI